jgi:hypothetical protein
MKRLFINLLVACLFGYGIYGILQSGVKSPEESILKEKFEQMNIPEDGPSIDQLMEKHKLWFDEEGNMIAILEWNPAIDPYIFKSDDLDKMRATEWYQSILRYED